LRSDLENNFLSVQNSSVEKLRSDFGQEAANSVVEQFKSLEDFIRSQFVEAALNVLAVHGQPSDLRFGKQYLGNNYDFVKLPAVKIVCRFGAPSDSAELLKISKDSWGEISYNAGIGALRLSTNPFQTARELIKSRNKKLIQAGFKALYSQNSQEARTFFEDLLNSESDLDRVRSVFYFSKKLKKKTLTKLLEEQFEKTTYYYNVVTWLDRLLYSPLQIRKFFIEELERQANPKSDA
jgi:hypothetical protein